MLRGCLYLLLLVLALPARGDFDAGRAAFDKGDYAAAFKAWEPLAKAGDGRAQLGVATLYESGQGVPAADVSLALKWYRAAAERGVAGARNNLGVLLATGRGAPIDPRAACDLWRDAAAKGYAPAEFNLALAHERGFGVPQDLETAARLYASAGNHGLAEAAFAISEMYRIGRGVPEHAELAAKWAEAARQLGSDMKPRTTFLAVLPPVTAAPAPAPAAPAVAEPTVAAPAPTTPATATDARGKFVVQLASLNSEADAKRRGQDLKSRYPDILTQPELLVRRVDLGGTKGVWYRVLAGPFATRADAAALCARLKSAPEPADCLVTSAP